MNIDTYLRIGSTHHTCEDYVVKTDNMVCLSDGCSSVENADIGARLVCHAKMIGNESKLLSIIETLGLHSSCLYATYLSIKQENSSLLFTRYGDGYLVFGTDNGRVILNGYHFAANMPYYLAYKLLNLDKEYNKSSIDNLNKFSTSTLVLRPDLIIESKPASETKILQESEALDLTNVKWVAILSDGLSSFVDKKFNAIAVEDICKEIFSFKNFNGEFVKRRMRAAFKKFDELGWKNTDDFSIGVAVVNV